ncbi:hypothetical protein [Afifella pfennigii]|uniref:hypothetical protein n=1 Tax=Afifella pfennigii TaxID=209897 RepID=UPI000479A57D|nr:hypothetical protein [Afifella pfennigii]
MADMPYEDSGAPSPPPPQAAKRVPMVFTAESWTASFRFNRSGRMESEAAYATGELAWRGADERAHRRPARLSLIKREANERLELSLSAEAGRITVPLDEGALQRMIERFKDYVSGHNMVLRAVFNAAEDASGQYLDVVDISFSSPEARGTRASEE